MPRPTARRLECDSGGFTLVELLVVMVIIAISFFALRPAFTGVIRGAEERNAIRQLVSLFTAARTEAVARGKLIRVAYDSGTGSFYAEIQAKPEEDRQAFDPLRLMGKTETRLPESLTLESIEIGGISVAGAQTPTIYFYPDGRTDGANLMLGRASGAAASLEIAPATGKVRLDA